MATLEDVSSQLMKPAKDLAEWKFPLSQILEDYYTLLERPQGLNFGEAALVLQNSANVYVRRVEYLYQEASNLIQSMTDHEQESASSVEKVPRKSRKSTIDFSNFELIDFSQESSKSINFKLLKDEKKVKFLSKRYPQLEKISPRNFSLEILDTSGEIIGRKYDFRCNQQLTALRMLVDEVTSSDFSKNPETSESTEAEIENEVADHFDSCFDYDTHCDGEVFSPTQESGYGSVSSSDINTPSSRVLTDFSQTLNDSLPDDSPVLSSEPENHPPECRIEHELTPEMSDQSDPIVDNVEEPQCIDGPAVCCETPSKIRHSTDTDAGYTSGDPDDLALASEPPKKIPRLAKNSVNQIDSFEPIPFDTTVPEKLPRSRREFKLPCDRSLLNYRVSNPKRKRNAAAAKRRGVKRFLEEHAETPSKRVMTEEKSADSLLRDRLDPPPHDGGACEPPEDAVESHFLPTADPCINSIALPLEASCSYTPPQSPVSMASLDDDYRLESPDFGQSHQERIEQKMQALQKEFDVQNEHEEKTKWLEMMEVLEKAKRRPIFDVTEWEQKIIHALKNKKECKIDFEHFCHREQPDDIARIFIASLHLANSHILDINVSNIENNKDKVSFVLLNDKK